MDRIQGVYREVAANSDFLLQASELLECLGDIID